MDAPPDRSAGGRGQSASRRATRTLLLWMAAAACSGPPPLLVISGPADVTSLEVRDARTVLWRIATDRPVKLSSITYGVVPAGFLQSFPENGGAPRPLVVGEAIATETVTIRRRFVHLGLADGPASFEISESEMHLLDPPDAATAAALRRRHRERLEALGKRLPPDPG